MLLQPTDSRATNQRYADWQTECWPTDCKLADWQYAGQMTDVAADQQLAGLPM